MNGKLVGRSALMYVTYLDEDGHKMEAKSKEEMEAACLEEAKQRFTQVNDTPLLQPPMYSEVGPTGFGPAAAEILDGSYHPPPYTDEHTKELLPMF